MRNIFGWGILAAAVAVAAGLAGGQVPRRAANPVKVPQLDLAPLTGVSPLSPAPVVAQADKKGDVKAEEKKGDEKADETPPPPAADPAGPDKPPRADIVAQLNQAQIGGFSFILSELARNPR